MAVGSSTKELSASIKLAAFATRHSHGEPTHGNDTLQKETIRAAIPYLEKVSAALPKDLDAALMLADALIQTKNPQKAVELYSKAKELQPRQRQNLAFAHRRGRGRRTN